MRFIVLPNRKKSQIEKLSCTSVKRYRCHGHFFSADHLREVPLKGAGPIDHGLCRGSYARDVLYVEGINTEGNPKKIQCGGYSEGLSNELSKLIEQHEETRIGTNQCDSSRGAEGSSGSEEGNR